ETEPGIVVRRFPTETPRSSVVRDRLGARILAGEPITIQDQQQWANASLRSSGLWHFVFDHGHRYRALIFAPYMFWTTYAVSQISSRRSIVMPCLHDEPPARLDIFRAMVEGAGAVWFLTEPEQDLAGRLYNLPIRHQVIGAPVSVPAERDGERFRAKYGIAEPFVYFAGRREWGKGWEDLLAAFADFTRRRRSSGRFQSAGLKLVTTGVGEVIPPLGCESDVIDLGLVPEQDRDDAMAAAAAYVQPSAMESFSLTVLEAMLAGTPVLANRASDVVAWHLERSGAGLGFANRAELVECLNFVADRPAAARALARSGRDYVIDNYHPGTVFGRLEDSLDRWFPVSPTMTPVESPGAGLMPAPPTKAPGPVGAGSAGADEVGAR
ncbi:MAG: glycosyltransferase, partial [Acidimicrobiia bacterium]|nr:glycosyltransferase [Acidimicrobiia bacterium]